MSHSKAKVGLKKGEENARTRNDKTAHRPKMVANTNLEEDALLESNIKDARHMAKTRGKRKATRKEKESQPGRRIT